MILPVDNDVLMRRMLQRTRSGPVLRSYAQAMGRAVTHADGPRIAVVDRMMPRLNGPGVCRLVRARNPYRDQTLLTSRKTDN